jgi:peroxin-5
MEAQDAWSEAQHLLGSGGSLTDATLLLETYIRRGTDLNLDKPAARQLEAWSLLGRVHAMNEKEEKALLAFDEGRQAIPGNEQSGAIGEMLTVSGRRLSRWSLGLKGRTSRSRM